FVASASHGVLDALTDGGLGIALFSPFDTGRYFFPWRPLRVSPIGIDAFFRYGGLEALASDIVWVWLPLLGALFGAEGLRAMRRKVKGHQGQRRA
ncbi:MAG: metal-dependent hydrolase, partial [Planctomycetota bacterium]